LCDGEYITDRELRGALTASAPVPSAAPTGHATEDASLAAVSRDHVVRILDRTQGNKKAAAVLLGVSRRALYRLLRRLDLDGSVRRRVP
jgi:DNA-binding NtrC family response regulator